MNSIHLGWSPFFKNQLTSGDRSRYSVGRILEDKLKYQASGRGALPTVGDWACASVRPEEGRAPVHRLLERRTKISRKGAGSVTGEQVLAGNIDTVFLVNSLDQDLKPPRIERYLELAGESGARPVLLLTKADLREEPAEAVAEIERRWKAIAVAHRERELREENAGFRRTR